MNRGGRTLRFGLSAQAEYHVAGKVTSEAPRGVGQRFALATPAGTVEVRLLLAGHHNVVNALGAAARFGGRGRAAAVGGCPFGAPLSASGRRAPLEGRGRPVARGRSAFGRPPSAWGIARVRDRFRVTPGTDSWFPRAVGGWSGGPPACG